MWPVEAPDETLVLIFKWLADLRTPAEAAVGVTLPCLSDSWFDLPRGPLGVFG